MARAERTKRVARLVSVLSSSTKGSTINQIVRATGSSRATAYRDLELLRSTGSGYKLEVATVNGEARYSLSGSALSMEPMTPREHAAMALARKALHPVEGSWPVRELDAILQRGRGVSREDDGMLWQLGTFSYDPALLAIIHHAVVDKRMLRIRYRGANDRAQQSRTLHPHKLHVVDQQPYLVAWDDQKRGMRTFKIARATQAKLLRTKCRIPKDAIAAGTANAKSVKVWQSAPVDVRIRITREAARFVHEWPLVSGQVLESGADGSIIVCATVYGFPETVRWALRWGRNAEVLSPEKLRESVQIELSDALAAYKARGTSRRKARTQP